MIIIQIIACCAVVGTIGAICAYSNKAIDVASKTSYQKGKAKGYSQGWNEREIIAKAELLDEKLERLLEDSKND